MSRRTRGETLPQTGDAHPPLGQVEFLVKLLGVVAVERRRPAGRGGVLAWSAAGTSLEGRGDGAEYVEAEGASSEGCAGEREPGRAPEIEEGFGFRRGRGRRRRL
jgi:hypothetical protein